METLLASYLRKECIITGEHLFCKLALLFLATTIPTITCNFQCLYFVNLHDLYTIEISILNSRKAKFDGEKYTYWKSEMRIISK